MSLANRVLIDSLETVTVETASGIDGQGKPAYASAVDVDARVVREVEVRRLANGEEVRSMATLWVPGSETTLPDEGDRVTTADGLVGIVLERMDGRDLQGGLDHVRLMLREE